MYDALFCFIIFFSFFGLCSGSKTTYNSKSKLQILSFTFTLNCRRCLFFPKVYRRCS
ncbi:hypothetical protein HanRHA438_Chr13g0581401 [Helianthus annuus]|nr:hypothetical protein HanIR_Chr13g0621001 [Helianthus annuus]KAJ0856701.1 hypothetical protein HanRHA438_Chr13g0581401 [Helianthus annuus]